MNDRRTNHSKKTGGHLLPASWPTEGCLLHTALYKLGVGGKGQPCLSGKGKKSWTCCEELGSRSLFPLASSKRACWWQRKKSLSAKVSVGAVTFWVMKDFISGKSIIVLCFDEWNVNSSLTFPPIIQLAITVATSFSPARQSGSSLALCHWSKCLVSASCAKLKKIVGNMFVNISLSSLLGNKPTS